MAADQPRVLSRAVPGHSQSTASPVLGIVPNLDNHRLISESPPDDADSQHRTHPTRDCPTRDAEHQYPEKSLDRQPTATVFLLGDTGEADPYLLRHPALAAHAGNIAFRQMHRDRSSRSADDAGEQGLDTNRPIVFMVGEHSLYDHYEPRLDATVLDKVREDLGQISDEVGMRLVLLYFKHIYPYFPVLSRSQMVSPAGELTTAVSSLPLALRAALYASAVPFMIYDDYLSTMLDVVPLSTQSLYRMAWTVITHEIHTPHLSTLQACLLLLQRDNVDQFVQWSPFQLSLVAWTVSLAQSLGLSTDCSTWRGIPPWEKRLRRRLWWATYVLDKWTLLTSGIASHIKDEDFDVLALSVADFASDAAGISSRPHDQNPRPGDGDASSAFGHFSHLVWLTTILSDIHASYFTIKASKATAYDFARASSLAEPLQSRLHSWKDSFGRFYTTPQANSEFRTPIDGNISLNLAYSTVKMLLYRAIMRALENWNGTEGVVDSNRQAVRLKAIECCEEIVEVLEQAPPGSWNAFWHKCRFLFFSFSFFFFFLPLLLYNVYRLTHIVARSYFAIASAFMMRLLITSVSPDEMNILNRLVHRWRWALRIGGGKAGSQLMSLGLLRLDRTLLNSGIRVP